MNKLIIIESGDRLGKGTLIKGLCEYYDYKNITLRHCDKPPKNTFTESALFQYTAFLEEAKLINNIFTMSNTYKYHDNIIIYDRFYPGEYVYSQMFRGGDPTMLKSNLLNFEKEFICSDKEKIDNTYLIMLTASPKFFLSKEDGKSFSQTLPEKEKELKLFKKAYDISLIKNKLLVKVDEIVDYQNIFRTKEDIFQEVIKFINKKNEFQYK